jgi:hypothetical protein
MIIRMKCFVQDENGNEQECHLLSPREFELNFVDRWGFATTSKRRKKLLRQQEKKMLRYGIALM